MFSVLPGQIMAGSWEGPASRSLFFVFGRQHLISLINAEDLDLFWLKCSVLDHVKHPAGCAHDDVNTFR